MADTFISPVLRCGLCGLRVTQGPEPLCSCSEREVGPSNGGESKHHEWTKGLQVLPGGQRVVCVAREERVGCR